MSLLHNQGIKYTSHATRFADKLVENIDGLIKDTTNKKIIVYLFFGLFNKDSQADSVPIALHW